MEKHSRYGVEIVDQDGPTGKFREVLEAEIQDYGGNVLQSGAVGEWLEGNPWRRPLVKVATKLGGEIASATTLLDCHKAE